MVLATKHLSLPPLRLTRIDAVAAWDQIRRGHHLRRDRSTPPRENGPTTRRTVGEIQKIAQQRTVDSKTMHRKPYAKKQELRHGAHPSRLPTTANITDRKFIVSIRRKTPDLPLLLFSKTAATMFVVTPSFSHFPLSPPFPSTDSSTPQNDPLSCYHC